MLSRTAKTSVTVETNKDGNSYGYVVQPISYTAICDNVSAEYAVKAEATAEQPESPKTNAPTAVYNSERNTLTILWEPVDGVDSYYVYKYNPDKKSVSKPRLITNRTKCSYRNLKAGTTYYFIITTEELSDRKGFDGGYSVKIYIPEA